MATDFFFCSSYFFEVSSNNYVVVSFFMYPLTIQRFWLQVQTLMWMHWHCLILNRITNIIHKPQNKTMRAMITITLFWISNGEGIVFYLPSANTFGVRFILDIYLVTSSFRFCWFCVYPFLLFVQNIQSVFFFYLLCVEVSP